MRRFALGLATLATLGAAPLPLAEQRARLKTANASAARAERRAAELQRSAADERDAAIKARREEAEVASRVQAAEASIVAAEARTAIVDRLLADARARLTVRQAPIVRLTAALQSIARRPTALALVEPGSTGDIVHVRAVLATLLPLVRARTAALRGEIDRVRKLRADAGLAAATLRGSRARLQSEQFALVRLEGEHRLRGRDLDRSALFESDRAIALGERARDLIDLMATTGNDAEIAASLTALPGPLPRPARVGEETSVAIVVPPRFGPPPYRLPAAGRVVEGLGELSSAGVRARGLGLQVRPGGQVVAPAPGRIVFARRFRDYGTVVVIDHGGGWTSALTGLAVATVAVGDQVTAGVPLGHAPMAELPRIGIELRRRDVPVDLAQLLD